MPVIPMPFGRREKTRHLRASETAAFRRSGRPIQGLVVDRAAAIRQLVMHATGSSARQAPLWFEASDLRTATQLLASFEFDIVVVDPRTVDGHIEAFTEFTGRPDGPVPYVVVISDEDRPQPIQDILAAGVECHISKSLPGAVLQDELSRVIRELFDQPNRSAQASWEDPSEAS